MNMHPARVLFIGNDQADLDVRASVMTSFWDIDVALPEPRFSLLKREEVADLVVICETIPEPERQALVERLRLERPTGLIIKMDGFDCGPYASADATIDADHGPGAVVATIYELLTERGLGSKMWPVPVDFVWIQ